MPPCYLAARELRRSAHRAVTGLEAGIRAWINEWNNDPRPFTWTKTAGEILETLAARCQARDASEQARRAGALLG